MGGATPGPQGQGFIPKKIKILKNKKEKLKILSLNFLIFLVLTP
jgi:hypothetical protein